MQFETLDLVANDAENISAAAVNQQELIQLKKKDRQDQQFYKQHEQQATTKLFVLLTPSNTCSVT